MQQSVVEEMAIWVSSIIQWPGRAYIIQQLIIGAWRLPDKAGPFPVIRINSPKQPGINHTKPIILLLRQIVSDYLRSSKLDSLQEKEKKRLTTTYTQYIEDASSFKYLFLIFKKGEEHLRPFDINI